MRKEFLFCLVSKHFSIIFKQEKKLFEAVQNKSYNVLNWNYRVMCYNFKTKKKEVEISHNIREYITNSPMALVISYVVGS